MDSNARKTNAHFIIHTVAVSAAAFSYAFSWVPGVGPTLGDSAVLTSLTIAMTMMLGALFKKKILASSAWSVGATAIGFALGTSLLKGGLSFIPFAGPWLNAIITLSLHEGIGWGLYRIFEKGLNPINMSSEELKSAFKEGGVIAEQYEEKSEKMDQIKKQMSSQDRESATNLEKNIASKDTSDDERISHIRQMAQLYKKYGYDVDI
jgi:uncharacterized protein (DUF697 family)